MEVHEKEKKKRPFQLLDQHHHGPGSLGSALDLLLHTP